MLTIMYLWICNGNVDHRFSTNEKLNFFKIILLTFMYVSVAYDAQTVHQLFRFPL